MLRALLVASAIVGVASPAQAGMTKAQADKRCHAGQDEPSGPEGRWPGGLQPDVARLTPYTVPGATRVSRYEADCLILSYDKGFFITPVNDSELIPFTMRVPYGGNGDDGDYPQVAKKLEEITGGDKDFPLISYCHNASCFLSYNLVLRAAKLGYRNLYWFRDGIDAHGNMLMPGEYAPADNKAHIAKYMSEAWFCRTFYSTAFPAEGASYAKALETYFKYKPGEAPNADALIVKYQKEVRDHIAEAEATDATAKKAGRDSYARENYVGEWVDTCDGILRGMGVISG